MMVEFFEDRLLKLRATNEFYRCGHMEHLEVDTPNFSVIYGLFSGSLRKS
jgi:hypothetical protein